jgi:hypothetical protein
MSALPEVKLPPVSDETLLNLGRSLAKDNIGPTDLRARLLLVAATHEQQFMRVDAADLTSYFDRAVQMAEDEADEAQRIATTRPRSQPRTTDGPAPLPGFTTAAIWEGAVLVAYLVKFILLRGGLTVLFGLSGHLKTVIATMIAFAVATGTACFGFKVERAGVVYIVGEGFAGMRKRARAWLLDHGYDSTSEQPSIYFTSAGADLVGNPAQLRATVEHAAKVLGIPIGLIVIDTLQANAGNADLNDARDMTLAIAGAQQAAPDAAVLLVHHVGHADPNRERASYQLIAAADVRLQAIYDEASKVLELKWRKLKDDDAPESLLFRPKVVPLGWEDEDGDEVSSVVLERLDGFSAPTVPRSVGLGKNQETAFKSLRTLLAKARKNLEQDNRDPADARILLDGWRRDLERRGITRQRFHDVLRDLQERRLIVVDGPHVAPIEGAI